MRPHTQTRLGPSLSFPPPPTPPPRTPPPHAPMQHRTCTALISQPSSMQPLAAERSSARPSSPRAIDIRAGRTRGAATSRAPAKDDTHVAGAARTGDSAAAEAPTNAYMVGGGGLVGGVAGERRRRRTSRRASRARWGAVSRRGGRWMDGTAMRAAKDLAKAALAHAAITSWVDVRSPAGQPAVSIRCEGPTGGAPRPRGFAISGRSSWV